MSKIETYFKGEELTKYETIKEFQKYFDNMAKYIFSHIAIVIGDAPNKNQIKYYLQEVEFYFNNNKITEDNIIFTKDGKSIEQKKNFFSCTYKRIRKAGDLFWHYSGVDICFETSNDDNCYGGILIRSLLKDNGEGVPQLIAGPLRCANELMNQCVMAKSIPNIEEIKQPLNIDNLRSTIRQGIETAEKYKEVLKEIENKDLKETDNFPFFCYYLQREDEGWKTDVDGKPVSYSSNPEKRMKKEREF